MIGKLRDWLDHRTGYRKLMEVLLIEHIPGGAKWRYVWGSCLLFVFSVQLITGILLMTSYSAGDSTAWSSVYYIQYEMDFGWLIRGLHHFGSQTMVVLLGIHMLQVVIAGAHLPPREVNWWLGLCLLGTVLALSLTGYLLPWDQKGYWATQVATNIAGNLPAAGPYVQKIVVGGPVYGHHTLTRFYALHVGVLPPLVIVLTILHMVVFRRHGVTVPFVTIPRDAAGEPMPSRTDGWFWPDQAFRDMVASMLIFGVMLALVLYGHGHKIETLAASESAGEAGPSFYERWAHAGRDGKGANLDAPADPARPYPARPEWYFLSLFQLLKYFEGEQEIVGTVFIPNGALVLLALLPLLGYGRMRKFGRVVGFIIVSGLLCGVAVMTTLAILDDKADTEKAKLFQKELKAADELAERSVQLAHDGIPAEGAIYLLRRDPLTQGKALFQSNCAICHSHGEEFKNPAATASDLEGFGTEKWIRDLLREPGSDGFLGHTKLKAMSNWVERTKKAANKKGNAAELEADFDKVAAWLGSHPHGDVPTEQDKGPFAEGYRTFEKRECINCHTYKGTGGGSAPGPDFTGYGDADWVRLMVMSPSDHLRYGSRNTMPAFRNLEGVAGEVVKEDFRRHKEMLLKELDDVPEVEKKRKEKDIEEATKLIQLSDVDRELIIRWLLKDYRVVFGGAPIGGPPKR